MTVSNLEDSQTPTTQHNKPRNSEAMTLASALNVKVRSLYDTRDTGSREALSDLDQAGRDSLFYGDSIEKRQVVEARAQARAYRTEKKKQRKLELLEEKERKAKEAARLKRGEGSEERPIRSEAHGKANAVLTPYLKTYQNVDENITSVLTYKNCPYQLVHEGGQFRMENPNVSNPQHQLFAALCVSRAPTFE